MMEKLTLDGEEKGVASRLQKEDEEVLQHEVADVVSMVAVRLSELLVVCPLTDDVEQRLQLWSRVRVKPVKQYTHAFAVPYVTKYITCMLMYKIFSEMLR